MFLISRTQFLKSLAKDLLESVVSAADHVDLQEASYKFLSDKCGVLSGSKIFQAADRLADNIVQIDNKKGLRSQCIDILSRSIFLEDWNDLCKRVDNTSQFEYRNIFSDAPLIPPRLPNPGEDASAQFHIFPFKETLEHDERFKSWKRIWNINPQSSLTRAFMPPCPPPTYFGEDILFCYPFNDWTYYDGSYPENLKGSTGKSALILTDIEGALSGVVLWNWWGAPYEKIRRMNGNDIYVLSKINDGWLVAARELRPNHSKSDNNLIIESALRLPNGEGLEIGGRRKSQERRYVRGHLTEAIRMLPSARDDPREELPVPKHYIELIDRALDRAMLKVISG